MSRIRRFELLGGSVRAIVDGKQIEFREREGWVLAALLLDGFVSKRSVRAATGLSDAGIRQLVSRTGRHAELVFRNERDEGWYLDRTSMSIDAVELVELVEGSQYASDAERATSFTRARALWRTGLPMFPELGPPSEEMYLRVQSAHSRAIASGRRILVVDDQIADAVANALRTNHVCETAESFEEFRAFEPRLGDFDLVVLDRRLRRETIDNSGDAIAERINQRSDAVPVFMMTFRLPSHVHLDDWEMKLGLAGVVIKENDGPEAEIDKIAQRINEVFRDGPIDRACSAIEASMVRYRRQATKQLTDGRSPAQSALLLEQMNRAADSVVERAQANDLAGARLRRGAFLRDYRLD